MHYSDDELDRGDLEFMRRQEDDAIERHRLAQRAARMQNALRIMYSLDEIASEIGDVGARQWHSDPLGIAVRLDEEAWRRVYALIERRQPKE